MTKREITKWLDSIPGTPVGIVDDEMTLRMKDTEDYLHEQNWSV